MIRMATIIVISTLLLSPCNALFFGLFSSKQTPKPDIVISNTTNVETNKTASEHHLRVIKTMYPIYTRVYFIPLHSYDSQYPQYIHTNLTVSQQPDSIYYYTNSQIRPSSIQNEYVKDQTPNSYLQKPIVVLPIEELPERTQKNGIPIEYGLPKLQMPTTLYDLPISSNIPNFRTGGYATGPV